MIRLPSARRIGRAAALTTTATALSGVTLVGAELLAARLRRYATPALGHAGRGTVGARTAPPLRLTMLGDATALGVGVETVQETLAWQLAELLAEHGRRVELTSAAVAGSRSADLAPQVARALIGSRPDVAVILVGAGDATALRRPGHAAGHLATAVRRLREAGVEVVVGACPDLGAVRAFAPPLRQLIGWASRRIASAQTAAARAAGGHAVDLGAETGPVFRADAGALSFDGFHPSSDGYRMWAHTLYPAVAAALHPRLSG